MRDAAGRPDLRVAGQRDVDDRADRRRMADRRDAADALPGRREHELGVARVSADVPTSAATFAVSTRWAPPVSTSSGSPSAVAKTSELAIAPTSTPSCAAAAAAVGAASGRIWTRPVHAGRFEDGVDGDAVRMHARRLLSRGCRTRSSTFRPSAPRAGPRPARCAGCTARTRSSRSRRTAAG